MVQSASTILGLKDVTLQRAMELAAAAYLQHEAGWSRSEQYYARDWYTCVENVLAEQPEQFDDIVTNMIYLLAMNGEMLDTAQVLA